MRFRMLRSVLVAAAVMLALPASPASADTVTAGSAPPLRFVSYNMCGNMCDHVNDSIATQRDDYVVTQADGSVWNADEIMLQEVCSNQFDDLQAKLAPKGFSGLFARTRPIDANICKGYGYGMAIFVKGYVKATKVIMLRQGQEAEDIDAPCMEHYIQNRLVWACSVHLYWLSDTTDDILWRHEEAAALANQAKVWEDSGVPVVLGGDFNDLPLSQTLSSFYSASLPGGTGTFREADETDTDEFYRSGCDPTQVTDCRSGALTFYNTESHVPNKIDYLLFSEQNFKSFQGDPQPLNLTLSDHQLYRGAANWADCGNPGTNPNGVLRRDASGALFRYSGRTDGTLAPPCKVGTGWNMMSTVVQHGDFDGNGSTDLIAVDGSGVLWLYPADSAGTFSGSTRRQIGTGWQIYNALLAPGDFNGDGKADLIGRDSSGVLWFYAGDGTGGYAPRASIGTGWQIYTTLLAPGDFNGDGKADLIGRDSAGDLWFYAGTGIVGSGNQGYLPKVKIGTGWQMYSTLVAAGDVNGDGKADLIGRDSAGDLWFYAGTGIVDSGNQGYLPREQVGSSFPQGELLF